MNRPHASHTLLVSAGVVATAALLLGLTGCNKAAKSGAEGHSPAVEKAAHVPGQANVVGKGTRFAVALFFKPTQPKVSQLFAVRTVVTKADGAAVKADAVTVDATMPAHGHGMMTKPQHQPTADGAWQTDGMKLHMHGRWVFEVTVRVGADTETLKIPFDQPPEAL